MMLSQLAMYEFLGEYMPRGTPRTRPLAECIRNGHKILVQITGIDLGYDPMKWHEYLCTTDAGAIGRDYRWTNRHKGFPKRIAKSLADDVWCAAVEELQAGNSKKAPAPSVANHCAMTIQDISVPLREGFPVWPGHEPLEIKRIRGFEMGDIVQISDLAIGCHTGTHLDAPRHFVDGGGLVDKIDLRRLIGPCHVVHYTGSDPITAEFFRGLNLPNPCRRVLLKCDQNAGKLDEPVFFEDYAGITQDAAQFLVDRGMICIGTDYLSIGPFHSGNVETHQTLLGAEVVIVEGLDFRQVTPGEYTLLCMPPAVPTDGMPCRAALLPAGALPETWA